MNVRNAVQKYRYSLILLKELVRSDFKLRYQGSVLGYVWSLLKPLFLFVILYFVFVEVFKVSGGMPNWAVGMLIGIVLWNFFSEITNLGLGSVVGRGDVLRKVNFPKYIVGLSTSVSALINLGFNMLIIGVFMAISGVDLSWSALLTPLYILEIFLFGLGLAFILSPLFVRFRDINFVWEIIMQGMFYASIVIYPVSMVLERKPGLAQFMLLNPVAQAIQDVRHVLVSPQYPTLQTIHGGWLSLVPYAIVVMTLIVGAWYFKRRSPHFAEEI